MEAREMHIYLDLELQKLNSQVTKNITPEEKDWFLNAGTHRYISSKMNPDSNPKHIGFEDTTKRLEDIKDLIREKPLDLLVNESEGSYAILPSDFFDSIRFDCKVGKDCEINIGKNKKTIYKTSFKLNLPIDDPLTLFRISLTINGVPQTVFDIDDLPANYFSNEAFFKQKFLLLKALFIKLQVKIEEILGTKVELYWKSYGTEYSLDTFTLITDEEITAITVNVNGDIVVNNTTNIELLKYKNEDTPLLSSIRLIDDEFYNKVKRSSLSNSRIESLIGLLRQSIIKVDIPKGVIGNTLLCSYICKPSLIDLNLSSSLNMSRKVCEEITRNTAQFIKMLISDDNYAAYVQENIISE